jgi:centromeric protein E
VAIFFLQHEERAFVLKFSAIEIYNEVVRDLLSAENTSLRLWDDAEVRATNSYIFREKKRKRRKGILPSPCTDYDLCCLLLQKGTYVENLTEVTLRDSDHLKELISTCEGGYC